MINLNYICFTSNTGFGLSAKRNIEALKSSNLYNIKITPLDIHSSNTKNNTTSDYISIYHCIPSMFRIEKIRTIYNLAIGVYETQNLPSNWIKECRKMNKILVPSKFCKDEFEKQGIEAFYLNHCLDMAQYTPKRSSDIPDTLKLLWMGSWRLRKGYDLIIQAFNELKLKNTELYIKTDEYSKATNYIKDMKNIFVIKENIEEDKMSDFMKRFDCIIQMSHGEGFGMIGLQSLALKIPLISGYTTGSRDYLFEESSTLVYPFEKKYYSMMDNIVQFKDRYWDDYNIEDIKKSIIFVRENYEECLRKSELGYLKIVKEYSYERFLERFKNCL